MKSINLTQHLTKENALNALILFYKYGLIHGNFAPVFNSGTGFWEIREV